MELLHEKQKLIDMRVINEHIVSHHRGKQTKTKRLSITFHLLSAIWIATTYDTTWKTLQQHV